MHQRTHTNPFNKTRIKSKRKRETDIEVRRVALDADLNVLRLNLAIELLRMNVRREVYVHVHIVQSLVPLEHLLI